MGKEIYATGRFPVLGLNNLRLGFRPATGADNAFVKQVFFSAHGQQFSILPLEPDALARLLQLQFDAWHKGTRARCPTSQLDIILVNDSTEAGIVWHDTSATSLRLLELSILPSYRGKGIGTAVLQEFASRAENSGLSLTCSVARDNPGALRLYERFGFRVRSSNEVYLELIR
jgi:ribosomal protein S18 acetylase RimI-like enzyme